MMMILMVVRGVEAAEVALVVIIQEAAATQVEVPAAQAALVAAVVALRTTITRPVVRIINYLRQTTPVRFAAAGIPSIQGSIQVTYSVMH